MTSWTERYLAAALTSIPEPKRADVEQELRSSIADAVEERVTAGEDRAVAERAVLQGLGDPALLAAAYTGRPTYLIGPDLYPIYRHFVTRLMATVVPIAAFILFAVTLASGDTVAGALAAGISAAINITLHVAFWTTLTFVFLERADAARQARTELVAMKGRWTLEQLPQPAPGRVTAGEVVGEVITIVLMIGGLFVLWGLRTTDAAGAQILLLDQSITNLWLPVFIVVLASLAVLQVVVYLAGRWTMPLALVHTALEVAFALPIVWLALNGTLVNPAYAAQVGYPPLAEGDAPVMLAVAVGITAVTAWEIFTVFRRARRADPPGPVIGASQRSA